MSDTKPPRFKQLAFDELNDAQKKAAEAILAGAKKADGPGGRYMAQSGQFPGPYNFLLRSPELAMRWRGMAEYIRFDTTVPLRLNELAILVQARWWTAQFEWWAHEPLAVRAGLDQSIADDLKVGKRPTAMKADEEAVYDFCIEMMENRRVSDATLAKLKAQLTEQQIVDLVAVTGFYATVSMILNTVEAGLPDGSEPPLKPLSAPLK